MNLNHMAPTAIRRNTRCLLRLTALIAASFPISVISAGFDCNKAKTTIEKYICSDADINRQDAMLMESYNRQMKNSINQETFKSEQKQWLKHRDQCFTKNSKFLVSDCLNEVYYTRIALIENSIRPLALDKHQYPDIWLVKKHKNLVAMTEPMTIYQFNNDSEISADFDNLKGDIFLYDTSHDEGKYSGRLRGFFSGKSIPVSLENQALPAFVTPSGIKLKPKPLVPYPTIKLANGVEAVDLKDGTYLRLNKQGLWQATTNPECERGTTSLEHIDRFGKILWSRVYLIDTRPSWFYLCSDAGSPANIDYAESALPFQSYFDDSTQSWGVKNIFPLEDGTILFGTWTHLLRLRIEDGLPGRVFQGFAALDTAEMIAFKREFKVIWENKHKAANENMRKCLGEFTTAENYNRLLETKCKSEDKNPYRDDLWHILLNSEIEHRYLMR